MIQGRCGGRPLPPKAAAEPPPAAARRAENRRSAAAGAAPARTPKQPWRQQTELCQMTSGSDPMDKGSIEVAGKSIRLGSPREAVAAGIALIPEDRQHHGLVLRLPIAYNITMPDMDRVSRLGVLKKRQEIVGRPKSTVKSCASSALSPASTRGTAERRKPAENCHCEMGGARRASFLV